MLVPLNYYDSLFLLDSVRLVTLSIEKIPYLNISPWDRCDSLKHGGVHSVYN